MKNVLPLRSFGVEGYRAIRHLRLPEVERVNLFVGLNNAGKTSLLEAVQLYASRTPRTVLAGILRERSGLRPRFSSSREREITGRQVSAAVDSVRALFHGTFAGKGGDPISLGPVDAIEDLLTISLPWAGAAFANTRDPVETELFLGPESPLIEIARGSEKAVLSLDWFLRRFGVMLTGTRSSTAFIPAQGLDPARVSELWDQVAAAGFAERVEDVLRGVLPELERIYLLGETGSSGRSVALQLRGMSLPVPLSSMGDGTIRVFALALSCVRARRGALLVDEVENGLHHSVQHEVWGAIFGLAETLEVQVFATTHSWDAVVAFQAAANQSSVQGILYRLEREADGSIYAERYSEEEVAVAASRQIEVR
jgi:predicted ATPase